MGRAQAAKRGIAVGRFKVVFGTRQGSPTAQAQRDRDELDELLIGLDDWQNSVIASGNTSGTVVRRLSKAYRERAANSGNTADGWLQWLQSQGGFEREDALRELVAALEVGDPARYPALTAPAMEVLAAYLREGEGTEAQTVKQDGAEVTEFLFARARNEGHYRRLQPLCEALADLLLRPEAEGAGSGGLGVAMAQAQLQAPTYTLDTGALQSWFDAFAARLEQDIAWPGELHELQKLLDEYDRPGVGRLRAAHTQYMQRNMSGS